MPHFTILSRVVVIRGFHLTENINKYSFEQVDRLLKRKGFSYKTAFDDNTWLWYTNNKNEPNFLTTQISFNVENKVHSKDFYQFGNHMNI